MHVYTQALHTHTHNMHIILTEFENSGSETHCLPILYLVSLPCASFSCRVTPQEPDLFCTCSEVCTTGEIMNLEVSTR